MVRYLSATMIKGKLKYAGKVGTGFSQATLTMLGKKLRALETTKCPFSDYDESTLGVHWVKPKLVGDFKFAEWTNAGRLRVPRYKGLRDDKDAKDVVKELPKKYHVRLYAFVIRMLFFCRHPYHGYRLAVAFTGVPHSENPAGTKAC